MANHEYQHPERYSLNNALQYNFAKKFLDKISFQDTSRILDIGCGDGAITYEMANIVQDACVLGIDISNPMVAFASKTYLAQSNLRFLQMNAENNIFREQFDIVTSFNCLHWVQNQENALRGIANAVVKGGQIFLLLSHRKSTYHLVLDKICSSSKWTEYFNDFSNPRVFFNSQSYLEIAVKCGLKIIEIAEEEIFHYFSAKEQLKDFFSAAGFQIKKIPEKLKNSFLDEFVNEFIKQIQWKPNSSIPISFWCLKIIASK